MFPKTPNIMQSFSKPIISYLKSADGKTIATFGFELKSIKKNHLSDEAVLQNNAIKWHNRFFNAISKNNLDCTVLYKIQNPNTAHKKGLPLRIAFIFCIKSDNKNQLTKDLKTFINELTILFEPQKSSQGEPYSFNAISDIENLKELIGTQLQTKNYEYTRKPVYYKKEAQKLGYKNVIKDNENFQSFPQAFIPDFFSINNVLQYIFEATDFIDFTLFLSPLSFPVSQLQQYKKKLSKSVLVDDNFTHNELETYKKQQELLLDDNTILFYFQVSLKTANGLRCGQSIHNTIADAIFGNINNVEITVTANNNAIPFTKEMLFEDLLPYIFSQEILLNSFRLPITAQDEIIWFPHQTNIFNYFPPDLPIKGITLGVKKFNAQEKTVRISQKDLSNHVYILGQTGVGKTTLMKTMILDQINNGEGVCVVDPHGDLVQSILANIPKHRKKDVIYFDPTTTKDIFINIIEVNPDFPEQRTFIFNELMKIFNEFYNLRYAGGPMFELYFKNTLFLLIEHQLTLKDIFPFFFDNLFRKELINSSKQEDIKQFFKTAVMMSGEQSFENFAPYITSKVNRFVMDDFIGPIISQKKSTINFREVIDSKKILLVRLPKGRLGSEGVRFIGTIIFNRIIMAAYTRENIKESERVPFNMYIDEFQNFTSNDLITALSESRKYKLRLIFANQTLGQLSEEIISIILGNVGTQIFFRPGIMDINRLYPYYKNDISENEMLYLPNYHAVGKIMNNSVPTKPFIFETKV